MPDSQPISDDLDTAPCGFLTFADNGIIHSVNHTLVNLLGYEHKEDIVGKNIEKLFSIAGRIFYQTHFYPLIMLHGKVDEIFFSLNTVNRESLPVICNAVRKEVNGTVTNHCILIPVRERQKYEQELLSAKREAEDALEKREDLVNAKKELELHRIDLDRQLSRLRQINNDISLFSKVISHDLQEYIHKIAVVANKVSMQIRQGTATTAPLEKIMEECKQLRHLAANLERFISLNTQTEHFVKADLNQVVAKAKASITSVETVSDTFNIEEFPEIEGYESQLTELFHNIFDNSFKFKDSIRPLAINVECTIIQQNSYRTIEGRYRYIDFVKITISDNGKGFDSQNKEQVFQLQKKIINNSLGVGFGLAFCKKIVDNHYGNISAESLLGEGTTITLLLPVKQIG